MVKKLLVLALVGSFAFASSHGEESHGSHEVHGAVADSVIAEQRANLEKNTHGKGFGPQAPRDIDSVTGTNNDTFSRAPEKSKMNLCDIHFHKNAEHKGGEFNKYAGNGDGHGYQGGWVYSGNPLSHAEMTSTHEDICPSAHGKLYPGDTIEVHYVYSTAPGATLGNSLGTCLSESIKNPQLRVEAQVYVLVNDEHAANFMELTKYGKVNGREQALNIPSSTGKPVEYEGSTTGPKYNEHASPFQVSWSVRPEIMKVNIDSVGEWCKGNVFKEDHAHGVRNIVKNQSLLSTITK